MDRVTNKLHFILEYPHGETRTLDSVHEVNSLILEDLWMGYSLAQTDSERETYYDMWESVHQRPINVTWSTERQIYTLSVGSVLSDEIELEEYSVTMIRTELPAENVGSDDKNVGSKTSVQRYLI